MILKANGKFIDTTPIKHLITQGEHNADAVYIVIDRTSDAMVDMSICTFIIKGINADGERAEQLVGITSIGETTISLLWVIRDIFSAVAGEMKLELRAYIDDVMVMKYRMGTIDIAESPNSEVAPDIDVVENAIDAMQSEVAAAAASAAAAEEVKIETEALIILTPYIYLGTWWIYSVADGEYINSNVRADATPTAEEKAEIEAAVLAECLTAIQRIEMPEGETSLSITMPNNTEIRCFDELEAITLSAPSALPDDYRSSVIFVSGSSPAVLSLPENSISITGDIVVEANTKYEIMFFYDGQDLCYSWFDIPIS